MHQLKYNPISLVSNVQLMIMASVLYDNSDREAPCLAVPSLGFPEPISHLHNAQHFYNTRTSALSKTHTTGQEQV